MREATLRNLIYLGVGFGLIFSIFSALEFVDAQLTAVCSFNAFFSCAAVANSGRTTFLGIQDYAWGIGGFLAILVAAGGSEKWPDDPRWTYGLLLITTIGIGFAMYLLYIEIWVIGALCVICASSYVMGLVAWAGSIALVRRSRELDRAADAES